MKTFGKISLFVILVYLLSGNGFVPKHLYRGCHHLNIADTTECVVADSFYVIQGIWTDGDECNFGFEYDGLGKITYKAQDGVFFLLNGVSDLQADKVCTVTYALVANGTVDTTFQTPTDFTAANKISNISITNFIKSQRGDFYQVAVKSNVANTQVIHNTLQLTFLGDR